MTSPDFYLRFIEGFHVEEPRRCLRVKQIAIGDRTDNLLVRVTPTCSGHLYGLDFPEIDFLVLGPKYQDGSVTPINEWPLNVYVWAPTIIGADLRNVLAPSEVKKIAFGEIYIDGAARIQFARLHYTNPW